MFVPVCAFLLFSSRARAVGIGMLLALLLGCGLSARPAQAQSAAFHFEGKHKHRVQLPFFLQRNLMVLQIWLNGKGPFNFVLDTGINTSLITDPRLRQELSLPVGRRFLVAGAGEENPLEAFHIPAVAVRLPGKVEAPALPFLMLSDDVLNLSGYVGIPIHGLLGSDVFQSFVVEVNPEEEVITLHNPASFQAPRGRRWARIPLDMEGRKPYVTLPVQLNDSLNLPLKLVLDTGAGHALSVETTSDVRLGLPTIRMRTQLGRGLNGNINGYLGRVPALQLGRYRVPALLTSFPDAADVAMRADVPRNGNLGFELLKRFTVIIDYAHNQLLLRPNNTFRDPFEHDMCGFEVLATGTNYRQYRVLRVDASGPAAEAGIQPGDEILSVNLLPSDAISLTQLSRLLHSQDGRTLLFVVRRSTGALFTTAVRLKRQI
ncbi:aspartyl protease family protein [Hymenobacter glacieicola]|nr:aspartyl protease family protein [Hymenobacter glacieicola]